MSVNEVKARNGSPAVLLLKVREWPAFRPVLCLRDRFFAAGAVAMNCSIEIVSTRASSATLRYRDSGNSVVIARVRLV